MQQCDSDQTCQMLPGPLMTGSARSISRIISLRRALRLVSRTESKRASLQRL